MNSCPFCNRQQPKKISEVKYCESVTGHSVVCQGCGALGPDCTTKREALQRWSIQPKRIPMKVSL